MHANDGHIFYVFDELLNHLLHFFASHTGLCSFQLTNLHLSSQLRDLFLELLNSTRLSNVLMHVLLDLARPASILHRVDCLLKREMWRRDACDHRCPSVSSKRIFEQSCQFGISIGYESFLCAEDVDAVAESEEGFVDVGSLEISDSSVLGVDTLLLRASQIHQRQFCDYNSVSNLLLNVELDNRMGARWELVGPRFCNYSSLIAIRNALQSSLSIVNRHLF